MLKVNVEIQALNILALMARESVRECTHEYCSNRLDTQLGKGLATHGTITTVTTFDPAAGE